MARVGAPVVLAFTVACPSTPSETTASTDESTSSTTEPTTGSTGESQGTTGEPPVPTTGMSSSTSEGETETTGEPGQAGPARVFYTVAGDKVGHARALRFVDVDGDEASPPQTLIEAPGDSGLSHVIVESKQRRYFAVGDVAASRLWIVDPQAGTAAQASAPPEVTSLVYPAFSPDETTLAITGRTAELASAIYVCSIAADGSCALAPLSPPAAPFLGLPADPFTSDGERLVYWSRDEAAKTLEVVLASPKAPGPGTVLATLPGTANATWWSWSKGEDAYYYAVQEAGTLELFGVDVATDPPGAPVLLHSTPAPSEAQAHWAPDRGALVVWRGSSGHGDLERVKLDGLAASPLNISESSAIAGHVERFSAAWSADSGRVVFEAYEEQEGHDEVYVVDLGASQPKPTRVSALLAPGHTAFTPSFTPGDEHVMYWVRDSAEEAPTAVMWAGLAPDGDVLSLTDPHDAYDVGNWSDDGSRLLYVARSSGTGRRDAYVADVSGASPVSWQLNGLPQIFYGDSAGERFPSLLAGDGRRAFFRVEAGEGGNALWMVEVGPDGPGSPVTLSEPGELVKRTAVVPLQ